MDEGALIQQVMGPQADPANKVVLNNERETVMNVKGLGNMTATAKGELVVQGLQLGTALRVPGLGINLISEGELQTQGCEIISKRELEKVIFSGSINY
jgi:hypothetical protein